MSLSSFLAKPSLRAPLLVATVIATVATSSAPLERRDDTTPSTRVDLPVGGTIESRIEYSASEPPELRVVLGHPAAQRGELRVEIVESRGSDCSGRATFTANGGWREVTDASATTPGVKRALEVASRCASVETRGTATVRFINTGNDPLAFEWLAKASISAGDDGASDDTFVEVKVVE